MIPKLYAILDIDTVRTRGLDPRAVLDDWLAQGATLIQLRAKNMASGELLTLATELSTRTHAAGRGAEFIVNDRADIALMAGADGVHLGQDDLRPGDVRRAFPDLRVIGLSTHNVDQLEQGLAEPATYFAIGPVFTTSSKAHPDPVVGLDGVRAAAALLARHGDRRPLVAIGGITPALAPEVFRAGAAAVAVISALFTYRISTFLPDAV